MKHPDELALELFVLGAGDVADREEEIRGHLAACAGCAAMADEMRAYYADLRAAEDAQPADALARTAQGRIVPSTPGAAPARDSLRHPAVKIVAALVRHPAATAASLAAALLFALGINYRTTIWKDTNPAGGRGRNDSLVVYNGDQQELWKAWIGYRHDLAFIPDWFRVDNWIVARDVDGDGRNEVLSCLPLRPDSVGTNYLGAWSAEGRSLWTSEFHASVTFGGRPVADDYRFLGMVADRYDPAGPEEVLAVVEHRSEPLRVVVRIDARTGRFLGAWWHNGDILQFAARDLDGDGRKEFVCAGVNTGLGSSFLAVIDPRHVGGKAPSTPVETRPAVPSGTERFYVVFPHPDVEKAASGSPVTTGMFETKGRDSLSISILTRVSDRQYLPLLYHFDARMDCIGVTTNAEFVAFQEEQRKRGVLTRRFGREYLEELRAGVRYWNGAAFVPGPVPNSVHDRAAVPGSPP